MVFTEKLIISVLSERANFVLAKKLCFVRKISCIVLPYLVLPKIFIFCNFGKKEFFLFQQKNYFTVWVENKIYGFCGKNLFFLRFVKNHFCSFAEKTHFVGIFFFGFPEKTRFCDLTENFTLQFGKKKIYGLMKKIR